METENKDERGIIRARRATAEEQRPSEYALARKATSDPCLLSPYANQTAAGLNVSAAALAFGVK